MVVTKSNAPDIWMWNAYWQGVPEGYDGNMSWGEGIAGDRPVMIQVEIGTKNSYRRWQDKTVLEF